jgi:Zn-dependent peptidase ImmA (M78 family)
MLLVCGTIIVLLCIRSGGRLRYSPTHEVGHLVMQQAYQGTRLELESQAEQFAAEFLITESAIRY